MDRDALVTLAQKRFRDTSNVIVGATTSTAISWIEYIDQAYRHVNAATPLWPWLETTTDATVSFAAGDRAAALPTDVLQVNSVYDVTNNVPLVPFAGRSGQFSDVSRVETGAPRFYRIQGSTIELYPLPAVATTLAVEVLTWPGSLAAGATEPAFPETFHHILVEGALAYAYLDDGNAEWHDRHWGKFEQQVTDMKNAILPFRDESYPVVRDNWWDQE